MTGEQYASPARGGARPNRRPHRAVTAVHGRGRWLILCHASDFPALWAFQGLRARGFGPLELVTAEMLSGALRWTHRVDTAGASVEIRLADGSVLTGDTLRGVINRITAVPLHFWRSAPAGEREYVEQELTALYVSWLHALPCPVLNRATALGLAGRWRHESEWVRLAAWAGLSTPTYRHATDDGVDEMRGERRLLPAGVPVRTIVVIDGRTVGACAPQSVLNGCIRLAALADTPLLGVEFTVGSAGRWTFAGATPTPDLRQGGPAVIDALADALSTPTRSGA